MNNDPTNPFGQTAKRLAKNPLGIIALFIVLVYGLAALMTAFSSSLTAPEKAPLIWFLIVFPVIVLFVFAWLVSMHSDKIRPENYLEPRDFADQSNFLKYQKQKMQAVASLTAASKKSDAPISENDLQEIVNTVDTVKQPSRAGRQETNGWHNHVLWVDDRPENNIYERRAFEAVGIRFTLTLSTSDALGLLRDNKYAAIISDMGRREGNREGYVLLDAIRHEDDQTPFFIYAGSNLPEHKREAVERGAQGLTNNPQELFQLVMNAVVTRI